MRERAPRRRGGRNPPALPPSIVRVPTGIRTLDDLLEGGLPRGASVLLEGPPGAGKTILAYQIAFAAAARGESVLSFMTLSEPAAKPLRFLRRFRFFDPALLDERLHLVDLGVLMRRQGLDGALELILEHVRKVTPSLVLIDTIKAFSDLAASPEEFRKFIYRLAVELMAWEATALFLGEYNGEADRDRSVLASVIDGIVELGYRESAGTIDRILRIRKMRGTAHVRDVQSFDIEEGGITIYTPRPPLARPGPAVPGREVGRCPTLVRGLDALLRGGIPRGASVIVAGVAGTGKTILSLEFVYRGAHELGERGLIFAFEESADQLRDTARGFGWAFDEELASGRVEIVHVPQREVHVERHMGLMAERIAASGARRVAVDTLSVFFYKVETAREAREHMHELSTIVEQAGATALLGVSIPFGSRQISRFGVEETVADGILLLTAEPRGSERQRFLEVLKLRQTDHAEGQYDFAIDADGARVATSYAIEPLREAVGWAVEPERRISSGVEGLDERLGGGLLERSVTYLLGGPGAGKTVFALQFALQGAKTGERSLYVSLDEAGEDLGRSASSLGLDLATAMADGGIELVHLPRHHLRVATLFSRIEELLRRGGARRLVVDGASHLDETGLSLAELGRLAYDAALRLKGLNVTSLFTFEMPLLDQAHSLRMSETIACVADNLLLLELRRDADRIEHVVTVVKTRASPADHGSHRIEIRRGGMRVVDRPARPDSPEPEEPRVVPPP